MRKTLTGSRPTWQPCLDRSHEGPNNIAVQLFSFPSLAEYDYGAGAPLMEEFIVASTGAIIG